MTSLRQIESNRRNALKSTGPKSFGGKQRVRANAVRHGLTAETVILPLEDPEEYKAFELAVTSNYDAETAVERELVLRLASLLWRLRRATLIETQLFRMQGEPPQEANQNCRLIDYPRLETTLGSSGSVMFAGSPKPTVAAQYFLGIASLEHAVFDRLGRYEAALWRQVRQTIFTLEGSRWQTARSAYSRGLGRDSIDRDRWDRG